MATIIFYEKPGCANNARQKRWLSASGHHLIVRDLLQTPWQEGTLRTFFGQRPVSDWFNRAAPAVKSGAIKPETLDAASALALMLKDPLLIRRPLMEIGERRIAGFDRDLLDSWIGLSNTPDEDHGSEQCHRQHPCKLSN